MRAQTASGRPLLVAEHEGRVVGWAGVGPYDDAAPWYAGVGEATVYVAAAARGSGAGRGLLEALERAAESEGRYKLIAKVFDTNELSLRLFASLGYGRVGVHRRHGRADGKRRMRAAGEAALRRCALATRYVPWPGSWSGGALHGSGVPEYGTGHGGMSMGPGASETQAS